MQNNFGNGTLRTTNHLQSSPRQLRVKLIRAPAPHLWISLSAICSCVFEISGQPSFRFAKQAGPLFLPPHIDVQTCVLEMLSAAVLLTSKVLKDSLHPVSIRSLCESNSQKHPVILIWSSTFRR